MVKMLRPVVGLIDIMRIFVALKLVVMYVGFDALMNERFNCSGMYYH